MPEGDVYDDGSEVERETADDEPPRDGVWHDGEEIIADLTEDEATMGDVLGERIDIDDDYDMGEEIVWEIERLTR